MGPRMNMVKQSHQSIKNWNITKIKQSKKKWKKNPYQAYFTGYTVDTGSNTCHYLDVGVFIAVIVNM